MRRIENRIRLTDPLQNQLWEFIVKNRKYIIGAIGLAVGFTVAFTYTYRLNKSEAAQAPARGGAMAGGGAGQQQMMAQVQQVIENARANPGDFEAQLGAARVFYQIGRTKEAVEYLEKAYTASPDKFKDNTKDTGALAFMGQYYFEEKNYPQAELWFNRAIKDEPEKSDYYVALAETFVQRQPPQPDRAIDYIQQALKFDPKNGHALGHLVEAFALKKDARSAEENLNKLKEADPSNDRLAKLQTMVADLKAGKPVSIPQE